MTAADTTISEDMTAHVAQLDAEADALFERARRVREEADNLRMRADIKDLCSDTEQWVTLLRDYPKSAASEVAQFSRIMSKRTELLHNSHYYPYPYALCQASSPTTSDNS